ncbi:MAG TPA: POTRA domain-containing protein [Pyrinomonadaceae bacterium]
MQKHFRSASLRAVSYTLSVFAAIGIFGATAINAQEATSPKRILDFEGNKIFSKQELLEVANKCLDGSSKSENQDEVLDYCLHRVRQFLSARGYLQAQLGKPREEQSEGVLKTIVTVKEGAQFRLGEVKVSGATTLTSEQVLGMFDLKAGDIAASDKIAEWVYERVKKSYGKFGYITYTGEVTPEFHVKDGAREGVVDLDVTVDEGKRFTIRTIKFEGNGSIPIDALKRDLLLRKGDIFDEELLQESLTRINRSGLFQPIDADRDVDYNSALGSSQVDLTLHLKKREAALIQLLRP